MLNMQLRSVSDLKLKKSHFLSNALTQEKREAVIVHT